MKTTTFVTLFILCLFCATAALGQASTGGATLSNQVQFATHAERATQAPMAQDQTLGNYNVLYAQGERPLWEVQPLAQAIPLGDVARMLKKQHETAKKSDIVWNN